MESVCVLELTCRGLQGEKRVCMKVMAFLFLQ